MPKVKTRGRLFLTGTAAMGLAGNKRMLFYLWNAAALIASAVGITVCSLWFAVGPYPREVLVAYFTHPLIFILNFIPVLLLEVLLYCAFNRKWPAFLTAAAVILLSSAGDYYKLKFRSDPFFATDISAIGTALGVASGYDLTPTRRVILIIVCVIVGTAILACFARGRAGKLRRVMTALLCIAAVFPLWKYVYSSDDVYEKVNANENINQWLEPQAFASRGFVYPFIHSVTDAIVTPPEGYSTAACREILAGYTDADIPENRRVNVIAVQLEAFCDLTILNIDGISDKAYEKFHKLEEESLSGNLVTDVFAGGTITTERQFLAGYSSPMHAKTPSHAWYFKEQGYKTTGSHPCYEGFYNRLNTNANIGFEEYFFLENHYAELSGGKIAYDDILFPEILRLYREDAENGNVFSFSVTYQGHGPYSYGGVEYQEHLWSGEGYTDYTYNVMNNYLGSVADTMDHVTAMIDELRNDTTPVVVVLYGDHKPWLGDNDSVYRELGIELGYYEPEIFENRFHTRYLFWANDAAKKVLGTDMTGEGPDVSANFLMNLLFSKLGYTGSAYMQYSSEVMETLSVINGYGIYSENGEWTVTLTPEAQALLEQYRCVNFYMQNYYYKDKVK